MIVLDWQQETGASNPTPKVVYTMAYGTAAIGKIGVIIYFI